MRFVTYNIQYSKGKDGVYDLARIAGEIDGADIIALQEVVRNGPGLPDPDQPERLAELFGGFHWVYGPALDMGVGGGPGTRLQFGNMVLSRWPILASRMLLLPRIRTFDRTSLERCALEAVLDTPSGPLRVYSVHLDHLNSRHRQAEIQWLRETVLSASSTGTTLTGQEWTLFDPPVPAVPVAAEAVVMGDFNMDAVSTEYEEMVGVTDPRYGRIVVGDRLVDTWTFTGHAIGEGVTWPSEDLPGKLDFVFVTAGLAERVSETWIDNAAVGSDHDPVWMELGPR